MSKYEAYGKIELDVHIQVDADSEEEALGIAEKKYCYHGQVCANKLDFVLFPNKHKLYLDNKGGNIMWYSAEEVRNNK